MFQFKNNFKSFYYLLKMLLYSYFLAKTRVQAYQLSTNFPGLHLRTPITWGWELPPQTLPSPHPTRDPSPMFRESDSPETFLDTPLILTLRTLPLQNESS